MVEREVAVLRMQVARLERQVAFLAQHLRVTLPEVANPGVSPDVVALARSGDKIAAIRRHRELTGADLRTAKEVVDAIE